MKQQSIRHQATVLTCTNALVRALGFLLRVVTSRLLGAQAVGVMELGHSAHMLSIAPVTAGLPLAVSRLTARENSTRALSAARSLVFLLSAVLIPVWLLFTPLIGALLGDLRVLPSLWAFTPCILVLGLSAVYNGFCYGRGNSWPPALSELTEQLLRFALTVGLLLALPNLTVAGRAAVPCVATLIAEIAGLGLVVLLLRRDPDCALLPPEAPMRREILRLSLPLTASRLLSTVLRALNGALIPRRLIASGLTGAEALSQLGMLQGMVMPVLFLPGVFTGALGMVGAPAIARRQGRELRILSLQLFASALCCGVLGMAVIHTAAGFLSHTIFHEPDLREMFVHAAPLTVLFALQQATGALLAGLGEQKRAPLPSLAGALLTLLLMYCWAAMPQLRIPGVIRAMQLGQTVTLLCSLAALLSAARMNT